MELTDLDLDFDVDEALSNLLIEAAKGAKGYVYYDSKLTRTKRGDNSVQVRIDIYEKYIAPSRKLADFLEERGVECVLHPRKSHKQ